MLIITEPDTKTCKVLDSSLLVKTNKKSAIPDLTITGDVTAEFKLQQYQNQLEKLTKGFVEEIDKHSLLVDTITCENIK